MSNYQEKRMLARKDIYRLRRTDADSCLGIVLAAIIVLVILNIAFRLYISYPIPSRKKPVLKGDYFWDNWRVKRYLRSWGIKAVDWLEEGTLPIQPVVCNEINHTCSLDLRGEKIDHLEWCDGLDIVSLDISGTRILNIEPLAFQTNLWELKLDNTLVSDLTPLAKWAGKTGRTTPFLHTLSIRNTRISDLSPLKDIDIENLYLDGIPCTDLSPVRTNLLTMITFCFKPTPGWKGTEHIRACTNIWVNMRHPSYAWKQYDYFYSGEVDQSRYASIDNAHAIMVALEKEYEAKKAKDPDAYDRLAPGSQK